MKQVGVSCKSCSFHIVLAKLSTDLFMHHRLSKYKNLIPNKITVGHFIGMDHKHALEEVPLELKNTSKD